MITFLASNMRSHPQGFDLLMIQVTVGSISRANGIAELFDAYPKPFSLSSERGFLTITGRYRGVPVSVVCIGMGGPNVDFFIREVRECVRGDMLIIR
jgi:uridine phosphorylase